MQTYTFTRDEILEATQAALDNWDFSVYDDSATGEQQRANLRDILDGSDNIGDDPGYPAECKSRAGREEAIIDWLHNYTLQTRERNWR